MSTTIHHLPSIANFVQPPPSLLCRQPLAGTLESPIPSTQFAQTLIIRNPRPQIHVQLFTFIPNSFHSWLDRQISSLNPKTIELNWCTSCFNCLGPTVNPNPRLRTDLLLTIKGLLFLWPSIGSAENTLDCIFPPQPGGLLLAESHSWWLFS